MPARPKLVVAISFPVYPPTTGGQARAFHLYRHLAQRFDIDLVTFARDGYPPFVGEIAPAVREIRVVKSSRHQQAEAEISRALLGLPVTDIAMPKLYRLSEQYVAALRHSASSAYRLVACHPYLIDAIKEASDLPFWYEAQDVEIALKPGLLPPGELAREYLGVIDHAERYCVRHSEHVVACTREDALALAAYYGVDEKKIHVVPNGVDVAALKFVAPDERRLIKRRLGLDGMFLALFMGSWHPPNIEAARQTIALARRCKNMAFAIIGGVCEAIERHHLPKNVLLLGQVSEAEKNLLLAACDIAVNPMSRGSGSSLKVLDYFAAGLPVVTTSVGARGFELEAGVHAIVCDIDQFPAAVLELRSSGESARLALAENARKHVEARYTWNCGARSLLAALGEAELS